MYVVDPWDWLKEDGSFVVEDMRTYRKMLRIARFIEYGGPLQPSETRGTLVECKKKQPKGTPPCIGLMWVQKTDYGGILVHCRVCKTSEMFVRNWQETEWADGMMEPLQLALDSDEPVTH